MSRFLIKLIESPARVFALFWCVLFLLYLPASQCGWVSDTLGWLESIQHQSFSEYINRTHFGVRSFYQTTQFVTWCLSKVFGVNHWAWHLIQLSLHALNCSLLFVLIKNIFRDSHLEKGAQYAFLSAALFCTSPYVSEVIVWEASFHYLQGMCFLLLLQVILIRFLNTGNWRLALTAFVLFGVSIFSLELFYLTPVFTTLMLLYYKLALGFDKSKIKAAFRMLLLPQAGLLLFHLVLVRLIFGTANARLGNALLKMPLGYYAIKPPDYFFHLFGGRFLPQTVRTSVHQFFCTYLGAGLFYVLLLGTVLFVIYRFKKMGRIGQARSLAFSWTLCAIGLVTPMWFPERLLILGDRYLYVVLPFFFATLVLLFAKWKRKTFAVLWSLIFLLQCFGTFFLSRLWQQSQMMTDQLQNSFSTEINKTTLLLNNPASMKGAPMIGAGRDGEFQLMHRLLYRGVIHEKVTDVLAANLVSKNDSLEILNVNASTIDVQLKTPGSYWWYEADYAKNYETEDYSVTLLSPSRYRLHLKKPGSDFLLKYQVNGSWYMHFMR